MPRRALRRVEAYATSEVSSLGQGQFSEEVYLASWFATYIDTCLSKPFKAMYKYKLDISTRKHLPFTGPESRGLFVCLC